MREIRPSGLEGGETLIRFPYPYVSIVPSGRKKFATWMKTLYLVAVLVEKVTTF